MAKGAKGHGAYYACEYCESKAQLLNIHDKALTRKKKTFQLNFLLLETIMIKIKLESLKVL